MRKNRRLGVVSLACLVLLGVAAPGAVAPGTSKDGGVAQAVVLENDRVRVHALTYPPGVKGPEHEHATSRVVVVLSGGTLEMRDAEGGTKTLSLKTGDVVWRPAEKHTVSNAGATEVRLVEIDLLDAARP